MHDGFYREEAKPAKDAKIEKRSLLPRALRFLRVFAVNQSP
jgi:hypothetical protein